MLMHTCRYAGLQHSSLQGKLTKIRHYQVAIVGAANIASMFVDSQIKASHIHAPLVQVAAGDGLCNLRYHRQVHLLEEDSLLAQGANTQLRSRVQDLAADLQGTREEVAALESLQEQLAADLDADEAVKGLIEAAVAREHAVQEARNRKVLDLLSSKVGAHPDGAPIVGARSWTK